MDKIAFPIFVGVPQLCLVGLFGSHVGLVVFIFASILFFVSVLSSMVRLFDFDFVDSCLFVGFSVCLLIDCWLIF